MLPFCDACAIQVEYCFMAEGVHSGVVQAAQVIREAAVRQAPNGIRYAAFGDNNLEDKDLDRMVQGGAGCDRGSAGSQDVLLRAACDERSQGQRSYSDSARLYA